jgi:hypothetical protein
VYPLIASAAMMTQSHFLITAFLGDRLGRRGVQVRLRGFLLGSLIPDLPLTILTFGYFAYRAWFVALPAGEHIFGPSYDALYFSNPLWVFWTSLFHAPLVIAVMALVGARTGRPALYWFALGCGLHSLIDIFTHHNDGPLVFFPFNWSYRFPAPVSYWHPAYGGRTFALFENALDLLILVYFVAVALAWAWRRFGDEPTGVQAETVTDQPAP